MSNLGKNGRLFFLAGTVGMTFLGCSAQPSFGTAQLQLSKTIPLHP
jgi:hypothetical protein